MKTILVLLDTVRKDYLSVYNDQTDVKTQNIEELAADSYVFDNHYTGSLPCMPARRDLFTGRMDFLERFWGALEPFDVLLQQELSTNSVPSHIITDHHHYWHFGAETYLQNFSTFQMIRGQESDHYISHLDNYQKPNPVHGRYNEQFFLNHSKVKNKDDYPTMQTISKAIEFVADHKDDENFFLQVEGFDPHEPFEAPQEFMDLYNLNENDIAEFYNSPQYGPLNDTPEQLDFITKKYKANLSFADYGVGRLIKKLKDLNIYDECNIIFTSDHGFHLGEHGVIGKGISHVYNEITQIPLIHKPPFNNQQIRVEHLTQNIDLMPTIIDMYNIQGDYNFHGKSYMALLNEKETDYEARDNIITGYHGQSTMITDHEYTYFKAPAREDNTPLNNYTAMPTMMKGFIGSKYGLLKMDSAAIEMGRFLEHTNYPVFKFPFAVKGRVNPMLGKIFENELYRKSDLKNINKLENEEVQKQMESKLIDALKKYESPEEQYVRLGLKKEQ